MFIPTWLLVVIVIVVLSILAPGIWSELSGLALTLFGLLVLVSIPASLYFFYQQDRQTAWVVSVPWIAMAAWGVLLMTRDGVRTSSVLHEMRVRAAPSPEAVEKLRRAFADSLGLGRKMWQLREDVKYFPSWYTKTNADGTPWTSNVIGTDEIMEVDGPDKARAAGLDPSALKIATPFVLYNFSSAGKPYSFCTRDRVESFGRQDDAACGVWVVEKPDRVVLSMRLSYTYGEYADSFESDCVETFKPGPWLRTLLGIVDRVHQDEHEKHERWRKQWERERAEKNFT